MTDQLRDTEAEEAVLGALMFSEDALGDVSSIVHAEDFSGVNRAIYSAAMTLYGAHKPVDLHTMRAALEGEKRVSPLDLQRLAEQMTTAGAAVHHAERVAEMATRRRLFEAAAEIQRLAKAGGDDVGSEAEATIYRAARHDDGDRLVPVEQAAWSAYEQLIEPAEPGLAMGFADLDREHRVRLRAGMLLIIAARPAVGKSSFVTQVARQLLRAGAGVAFFSLEMGVEEIGLRLLINDARVPEAALRANSDKALDALEALGNAPGWISDASAVTLVDIRATTRRLSARGQLGAVIVDYLQLMSGSARAENRQQEIAEISRGLKTLARELRVPVLACSQLNRLSESRAGKKPQLSDLRESGAIEQDADVVLLLHRDDDAPGITEVIVAKHRNGPTGTVKLTWRSELMRFEDYSPGQAEMGGDRATRRDLD